MVTISEEEEIARRIRDWFGPDDPPLSPIACGCMGPPSNVRTNLCHCDLNYEAARRAGKLPANPVF